MSQTVSINPLTRIEGHLSVQTETEPIDGSSGVRVTDARCEGEMFRGFEQILHGRDPLDAQQFAQRICGVCPVSQGLAAVRAQEAAYGIVPNDNGRLMQNLILVANYLQSHVLHFYHLAALDFVDVTAVLRYEGEVPALVSLKHWVETAVNRGDVLPAAPFLPRFEGDYVADLDANMSLLSHYVEALDVRRLCHEMGAVFGARLPHTTALVPGGVTQRVTTERVLAYRSRLKQIMAFVHNVYIPDLLEVAGAFPQYFEIGRGCGNFLAYGAFWMNGSGDKFFRPGTLIDGRWDALVPERIFEDVTSSRFRSPSGLHPSRGETVPDPHKRGAYSWIKAPRYDGHVMEVGPLARVLTNYHDSGNAWIKREVDAFLVAAQVPIEKLTSVLGRHVARGLESQWLGRQAFQWLDELDPNRPPARKFEIPKSGRGIGLTEAPRGALGHWFSIENHLIDRYQCIVPTTWNCSPRDEAGQPGAVEQALIGADVADPDQPIEIGRIVRSFDPCIGCAVH